MISISYEIIANVEYSFRTVKYHSNSNDHLTKHIYFVLEYWEEFNIDLLVNNNHLIWFWFHCLYWFSFFYSNSNIDSYLNTNHQYSYPIFIISNSFFHLFILKLVSHFWNLSYSYLFRILKETNIHSYYKLNQYTSYLLLFIQTKYQFNQETNQLLNSMILFILIHNQITFEYWNFYMILIIKIKKMKFVNWRIDLINIEEWKWLFWYTQYNRSE